MAKDFVFTDYFYSVDVFDRAFGDAQGQLNAIKLGMKPKRPDKAKLKTLLDKASKPPTRAKGEFVLSLDGDKVSKGMLGAANYEGTEYNEWSSEFSAWIKLKGHQRFTAFVQGKIKTAETEIAALQKRLKVMKAD